MHSVPDVNHNDIRTLTFPNAIWLCEELDRNAVTGQWHAVVMADEDHDITDKVMLESFTIDHVAGWAMGYRHAEECCAHAALFISAVSHELNQPDALDLWEYECLRATLGSTGLELCDWLLTDGFDIRSLAYTRSPESAWLTDPLPLRSQQLDQQDPGLA